MPMRNSMRLSVATPVSRSGIACCTSTAQRTASTTLANSTSRPSPVVLTMRPWCSAIVGSRSSWRKALRRSSVPSSSAPISREYPATSAARIAARRRLAVILAWRLIDELRLTENPRYYPLLLRIAPALSTAENREAQSGGGGSQIPVERGERQAVTLRELQVSGVISGQSKAFREARCRRPCLARGFGIEADRQSVQKSSQTLSPRRVEATAALGDQEPVQRFQRPKPGCQGAPLSHTLEQRRCGRRPLVFEAPCQRYRVVQDKAHDRPSLIRSLILRQPRVTPRLASSSPATARRAFARSKSGPAGTSLATGLPRRVMTISSPRST